MVLRKAVQLDSLFIAKMVMMALHMGIDEKFYSEMCAVVRRDDTLYSWRNSILVEIDGKLVGLCLAYDAANYHEMRSVTFPLFSSSDSSIHQQADEAYPGEYYIDSLSVEPDYRKLGIASYLLRDAIEKAKAFSLTPTLLVDPENTQALKLYAKVGFQYCSEQYAFGKIYQKWKYFGE
ncbi:MAG: GNAT family N-acetyltransferase [Prevotellaceae bacterium]|nr:GNAT family N-acetyltransferase [Candidatus Faecinaster equi]